MLWFYSDFESRRPGCPNASIGAFITCVGDRPTGRVRQAPSIISSAGEAASTSPASFSLPFASRCASDTSETPTSPTSRYTKPPCLTLRRQDSRCACYRVDMGSVMLTRNQSSETLAALASVFDGYNDEEKKAQIKKVRPHLAPPQTARRSNHARPTDQRHLRAAREERGGQGGRVDDRHEVDRERVQGRGEVEAERDPHHVRRDLPATRRGQGAHSPIAWFCMCSSTSRA